MQGCRKEQINLADLTRIPPDVMEKLGAVAPEQRNEVYTSAIYDGPKEHPFIAVSQMMEVCAEQHGLRFHFSTIAFEGDFVGFGPQKIS